MDWIRWVEEGDQWQVIVNTVMTFELVRFLGISW